ncbi:hypothetical protein [Variovorax sp.]|uniref:hypothetical protein n=1 Tax=Variovorax sp. TaxID=1871043 RepID=UPI003BAA6015
MTEPLTIEDRYSAAIRSSNLKIDPRTKRSDSDVLGAMGLAARHFPLAVALQRLFLGDNTAAKEIVEILADDVWKKARGMRIKLNRVQAYDLARASVAWHRNPTCTACHGHGATVIPGTKTLGVVCTSCRGEGRTSLAKLFKDLAPLADWLVAHMEKHQAMAGPEAMKQLAGYLELKLDCAAAEKS